jgi:hypothetical protein
VCHPKNIRLSEGGSNIIINPCRRRPQRSSDELFPLPAEKNYPPTETKLFQKQERIEVEINAISSNILNPALHKEEVKKKFGYY